MHKNIFDTELANDESFSIEKRFREIRLNGKIENLLFFENITATISNWNQVHSEECWGRSWKTNLVAVWGLSP